MSRLATWGVATLPAAARDVPHETLEELGGKNSFILMRLVAEGGSGEVWQALQTSLDRVVAVKRIQQKHYERLKSDGQDARFLDHQFQQEAVITAHLEHPNIVPVYDLGTDGEGRLLLAMKLVRGTPWDLLLDSEFRKLHMDDFLARHLPTLISMCQAVAFAHSKRIIHRDLKPSQVMVGEFGEVLLMDWGLALMMDTAPGDASPFARPMQRLATPTTATNPAGTPSMMAPEQTLESAVGISPQTDIYLLGGTLYYLLTGQYPHEAETSEESIEHSRTVDVVVPSRDMYGRVIPSELADLARRALCRDPGRRPQSVEEFMSDIRDYISGSSRRKESQELTERARKSMDELDARVARDSIARSDTSELYQELSACLGLLERAIVRWPGNPEVPALHERLLQQYAGVALFHGDLALARIMAERIDDVPAKLETVQKVERRELQIRQERHQRRLGIVAAGVLAIVLFAVVLQYSASMTSKNTELESRQALLEEASIAARSAERIALRESEQAHMARLAAEREQYFSSILIAEIAVNEGGLEKAMDVLLTKSPADFRNWEWGHLLARLHPEDIMVRGDHDFFHGAFTNDSSRFLLSSHGHLQVRNPVTGRMEDKIPAGRSVVWSFDLNPDNSLIAAASFDARTFVLGYPGGDMIHEFVALEYQRVARFSPDGKRLLTGGADNRFHIYDVETGGLIFQSGNLTNHAYCAEWSPDGSRFVLAIMRTAVNVYDAQTGEVLGRLPGIEENTLGLRWSRDGRHILAASTDNKARLFDAESLQLIQTFDNVTNWLHDADISPDGKLVATADDVGTSRLFDVATGQQVGLIRTLGPMFKVRFSPDGDSLLTVSAREARLVNLSRLDRIVERADMADPRDGHGVPGMRVYGVPSYRDRVFAEMESIWNVSSGGTIITSGEDRFVVRSRYAATAPSGEWVATIDPYGSGASVRTRPEDALLAVVGDSRMIDLTADPQGRFLALAEQQRVVHLIDTDTWALARSLRAPPEGTQEGADPYFINQIAFSPDGQYLAAGAMGGGVILWEVESGDIARHWTPDSPGDVTGICLAFSPDGRLLASGGSRSHVVIWDIGTGDLVSTMTGHGRTVYHIAFSPDGQRIVTSSRDQTVRLWEVTSGREVLVLYEGDQTPVATAFGEETGSIAIALADGSVQILESFPVDETTLPGDESMAIADRIEMWKRMRRTGAPITPADIKPEYGDDVLVAEAPGMVTEMAGP